LGTDAGGSVRLPAAFCGVAGLKPTYGRVSRYGVIAYASSLDQVGPIAREVADVAVVLEAIAGHDPADSTASPRPVPSYAAALDGSVRGLRLGLPREYFVEGMQPDVERGVRAAVAELERLGAAVAPVSRPHTEYAIAHDRLPPGREDGRPAHHVPVGHLHHLGQPGGPPRPRPALRLRRRGAADRAPGDRPALRRGDRAAHRARLRAGDRVASPERAAVSALEPVIGLEVHAELLTRSKIFCACTAEFGGPPNTNVCPVCTGMPGVLPVLNRRVVEFAIRAGLA